MDFGSLVLALSFAAPAVLYGLAALAVPILIHLLFKARKQTVVFSWIHFIRESVVRKSSRLRFQELLLLLLRLAALALIVLAFARPYVKAGPDTPASGPSDLVILLDDSFSMGAADGGRTRFAAAVEKADNEIKQLSRGDRVGILKTTPPFELLGFSDDLAAARGLLRELKPSFASAPYPPALRRAVGLLSESSASRRELVFLSDFQRSSWPGSWAAVADFPANATLRVAPVGAGIVDNLCVVDVTPLTRLQREDDHVRVGVRVANFSLQPFPDLRVEIMADGASIAGKRIDLAPGDIREILFEVPAPPAEQVGQARLHANDVLPIDNVRPFRLTPTTPLRVLCVEDEIADVPYFQSTHFLRTALNPVTERGGRHRSFDARVLSVRELHADELTAVDALVLANVSGVTESQAQDITRFVRSGGGLLVFCGDRTEPALYDVRLYRKGVGPLPARIAGSAGRARGEPPWTLRRPDTSHPVLAAFSGLEAEFARPEFQRIATVTETAEEASTLLFFDDGAPALAIRPFGKGHSALVLTSADTTWTDLPKRAEVYVPLMHQLLRYVAGAEQTQEQASYHPGDALRLPAEAPDTGALKLVGAEGEPRVLSTEEVEDGATLPVALPGVYALTNAEGKPLRRYTVNLDPEESDLTPVVPEERNRLERRGAEQREEIAAAERSLASPATGDRRLWRSALILALVLMLCEVWLAGRLGG